MSTLKKAAAGIVFISAAVISLSVESAQINAAGYARPSSATSSNNNNFTVLANGTFLDGSNDVTMTWDGTVFTSSSDYTGPGSTSNMTLSSPSTFLGYPWIAHDIQLFRPGMYTFNTSLGGGNGEFGIQTLLISPGQIGMHMLFDWAGSTNIDISVLWGAPQMFGKTPNQQTLTGTAIWSAASIDGDGDGIPGIQMAAGGPLATFLQINFNLNGIRGATPEDVIPLPASAWLLTSGLLCVLGVARYRKCS